MINTKWGTFSRKRIRVVVQRWDSDTIWALDTERDELLQICYGSANEYLTRGGKGEWSYLGKIMAEGTQLNLVRVRERDGVCLPELIIYEPDYLINITTVASCFETYAESPYVNLVNKIKPQANSVPIHLGNLAGEFLDDTVHQRNVSFDDAFRRFIVRNSLGLIACKEMADKATFEQFRSDAGKQQRNIQQLVGEDLPASMAHYDRRKVLLEPSFLSELLGIQGRMDFLHTGDDGNTLIIEQKSGKGAFPAGNSPDIPIPQEKHVVQLILYRALYIYGFDKYSDQLKHVMLLYSKYPKGLIDVAQDSGLFLRAIRMRNLLAWCEITYAEEGMNLLRTLTPETLNRKKLSGRLWDGFIRGQLQELLLPVSMATKLEQDYYLRFMRFIAKEQKLSKLGNGTIDNPGFAAVWNSTLQEKKEAGSIFDALVVADCDGREGMVSSVRLAFTVKKDADATNFRVGDIVILYPYAVGNVPDACAQMVHRATIVDISADYITLRLRNPQTDERLIRVGEGLLFAIEHDLFESSSGGLYGAMHAFLSAPKERRDLLLCQRKPRRDESIALKGDYGAFNKLVLGAKQARDFYIVIGPPGTGKTSHGLVNILNEELSEEKGCVLLLSFTNRAVDEICSKLEEQGLDYIRVGSEQSCSVEFRHRLLGKKAAQCSSGNEVARLLRETRVVCGTTSAINANVALLGIKHFSLAIIDEASQILEPHLVGLLSANSAGRTAIERFVLIGDHKQLPAVVQQNTEESAVEEESLRAIGLTDCRHSLFERLLKWVKGSDPLTHNQVDADVQEEACCYMLTKQGRMHPDIAEFPNEAFYGGKLDVVPLKHQQRAEGKEAFRVTFHASKACQSMSPDKVNEVEAEMMARRVYDIYMQNKESFSPYSTVGIIVPYRNQIATVRNAIDAYGVSVLHDITIDTVERYQGSQRDYILYGFTVRKGYQLSFLAAETFEEDGLLIDRKLNVAMTRARLYLDIFGNPDVLDHNVTYRKLMAFLREKGAFSI